MMDVWKSICTAVVFPLVSIHRKTLLTSQSAHNKSLSIRSWILPQTDILTKKGCMSILIDKFPLDSLINLHPTSSFL